MTLSPGTRLGVYEISGPLGQGGMGEVYRARDTKLDRDVAIKILPDAFAHDADRVARFTREAKTLAALNHPHIAGVYGLEESGAVTALVMELVGGEDLSTRIGCGPLPVAEALPIAKQIAAALEAAHEQGIVHRDLKPANIKVRDDGTVKVLDFGLAKLVEQGSGIRDQGSGSASMSPTITSPAMTQAGMILGTAAYMSPEQAKGRAVDKRSDIWAFGAVLYEMLTGTRAFAGEDVSDTLAQILMTDPNWDALAATVPATVKTVIRRCLEKNPKQRMRDMGDVALALDGAFTVAAAASPAMSAPPRTPRFAWVVAAVALLAAAALAWPAWRHVRETPPDPRVVKTTLLPPDGAEFSMVAPYPLPAISPDGSRLVFGALANGKMQLYLRRLDAVIAQPLPGTEDAAVPFWSPDSRWIAFGQGNRLKKIDSLGGPPITIADLSAPLRGGTWNRDGVILFGVNAPAPIQRVSAGGGTAAPAIAYDGQISYRNAWFLPDGRHFLYTSSVPNNIPVQVGSLDEPTKPGKVVAQANSATVAYAQGHLLFLRDNTLMAQPFDLSRLETSGEAMPVAEGVPTYTNPSRLAGFTVSENGFVVAQLGEDAVQSSRLVWKDRHGVVVGTLGEPTGFVGDVEASPDWKRVATVITDKTAEDIWIYDVDRGIPARFTFDPKNDRSPRWSPDGNTIYFRSNRDGRYGLFRKSANGAGTDQLVFADGTDDLADSISPDGKLLLVETQAGPRNTDISILPLTGADMPQKTSLRPLLNGPASESGAQFSPDGRAVTYASITESGQYQVYVAPFPGPGGKRQVSTTSGGMPRWRRDGKELFYVTQDGQLMAAEITIGNGTIDVGRTERLFDGLVTSRGLTYEATSDGQKFLVVDDGVKGTRPLTLIQNWTAALKK